MATGSITPAPKSADLGAPIDYEKFITEDDKPVDSVYSERQHLLLTTPLIDSWPGPGAGCPFFLSTDVGFFYDVKKPPYSPDVLLSLGVSPPQGDPSLKQNHSYYLWQYNKVPDAIVEVVSNKVGGELTKKFKGFARIGVVYYIVWDPYQFLGAKQLHCFVLERGKYVSCAPWFPALELGVKIWEGDYGQVQATFLRWCDRKGNLIATGAERAEQEKQRADEQEQRADKQTLHTEQFRRRAEQEKQRAEQEKQRAEQEKQRAEQEKQRAEQGKQRAERLAEKLRALGGDPDQP